MEGQVSETQSLQEGDLVLGRTFGYDKLKPNWEGPLQSSMMNQRARNCATIMNLNSCTYLDVKLKINYLRDLINCDK